jgi:rhamnosyl/mannosyltransferase
MAAGRPVISTDLPTGVPWVNQDGVSGIVVPPGQPAALAAAIARLGADGDLRRRMGADALKRARSMFSFDQMIDAFKGVVDDVMTRPAGEQSHGVVRAGAQ